MEISGIFGAGYASALTLGADQQSSLAEILAKYDAENMTDEDKDALKRDLADAGLARSQMAMNMVRQAGFEIDSISSANKAEEETPSTNGRSMQKGDLWDIYQEYVSGRITEQDFLAQIGGKTAAGSLFTKVS